MKVIVEADGGSRGNPGPAGYGTVVWSADHGAVLAESKQAIGRATNNVAEYRGLIAGLEEAAKLGATDVDVFMDSKLVVEQMSGRWKVKHPDIAVLHQQATALSTRFDRITYAWIPRAKNSHADRLANEAMDAAAEIEAPAEAPSQSQTPSSSRGLDRCPRRPDPVPVAAPRADRVVHAAAVFRPRQPGPDRRRQAPGRGRRTVPRAEGRHHCRHHLTAAARLRHGGDRGEGTRPRRRRRPRPDRNGFRGMGRADVR